MATFDASNHYSWWSRAGLKQTTKAISLVELIQVIPDREKTHTAVNIGAQDGTNHDPVFPLYRDLNFTGLLFEGNNDSLPLLRRNMAQINESGQLFIVEEFARINSITRSSIDFQYIAFLNIN